ncbi:MAG TPA: transcription termination/antitermination NusG family protein [Verrucomicrobiae bacterium]
MDWINDLNWFAIQTKPHLERVAAAHVTKLDVEIFLPRCRREQAVCGITRVVSSPLFPGYFFARFCPIISFDAVRYAPGVLRVVGSRRFPIPLVPEIITDIRDRLQPDGFMPLDRTRFTSGDRVTIEQGPLTGWMGCVEREWDDGKRVQILLETIQQARLLIDRKWLALAEV